MIWSLQIINIDKETVAMSTVGMGHVLGCQGAQEKGVVDPLVNTINHGSQ